MLNRAYKHCDCCKKKVAEKGLIFFHTIQDYVTVRMDEAPTYADDATRSNWHFCLPCWFGIMKAAREARK